MNKKWCLLATAILLATLSFSARAEPVRAVFFPDGADVTERLSLKPENRNGRLAVVLDLPILADPSTLKLDLPKSLILADLTWEKIPDAYRGKGLALFNQLEELRGKLNDLTSRKTAITAQLGFWTGQAPFKTMTASEASGLSKAIGDNVAELSASQYGLDKDIALLTRRIKALEALLAKAAGPERALWRVTAFVAGSPGGAVPVTASYLLRGAGWRPVCRFNALPEKNRIDFTYEAELWQNSGLDFAATDIALATLRSTSRTQPPRLRPWIIQPRQDVDAFAADSAAPRGAKLMVAQEANIMVEAAGAPPPTPVFDAGATFGLWELGKRDVPAGDRIRLEIEKAAWKADFSWLLRPSVAEESFLRSKAVLEKGLDIPPAKGLFLINGKLLGTRNVHLAGREQTLFFGSDPTVKAHEKLVERKSGETGLLSSKQTDRWIYEIRVENTKERSVPIRLEEPRPVTRDERITLEVSADPMPEIDPKDDVWFWSFDLPARGNRTISYRVNVSAPEDMNLNPGR